MSYQIKPLIAVTIVSLISISSLVSSPSPAQAVFVGEEECAPAVLMLKGSGEGRTPDIFDEDGDGDTEEKIPIKPVNYLDSQDENVMLETNGHEGAVMSRLLTAFVKTTEPSETISKVRFIGVKYTALDVFPELMAYPDPSELPSGVNHTVNTIVTTYNSIKFADHIISYNESFREGAEMVVDIIEADERRGCDTQYMLLSYSQGVMSARLALKLLGNNTDKVVSSYVLGDPFQKSLGATSTRQISVANTSTDTDGVGRVAINTLKITALARMISDPNLFQYPFMLSGLESFENDLIYADPVIYRDEGEDGIVSRSLCHDYDPTCSPSIPFDMAQHLNYFNRLETAGTTDLLLEVPEFDKQVRKLIESASANLGPRTLKSTSVVKGGAVTYNVANSRPDDMCAWDVDSDGTVEDTLNCAPYTVTHDTFPAKMTVTVTDENNEQFVLTTQEQGIDPDIVAKLTSLQEDVWYQLHPYGDPDACVAFTQDTYDFIRSYDKEAAVEDCRTANPSGLTELTDTSKQVFKVTAHDDSKRIAWGYDDGYNWDSPSSSHPSGLVNLYRNDEFTSHHFTPTLFSVVDGIPYYTFQHRDGNCVARTDTNQVGMFENCSSFDINQLFSVTPVSGEYGNLSMEKDMTTPSEIAQLSMEKTSNDSAALSWGGSTDSRLGEVEYRIYQEGSSEPVATVSDTSYSLYLGYLPENQVVDYRVTAVDGSGNETEGLTVSVNSPVAYSKPPAPVLSETSADYGSLTLQLPYDSSVSGDRVNVYRDGEYWSTVTGPVFTDYVARGSTYVYTYETVGEFDVVSPMSDPLTVVNKNTVPPSPPTNLSLSWQQGSNVYIEWLSGSDDVSTDLTFHLYRDGVRLTENYSATGFGATDFSALPGHTHVYTGVTEDEDGNLSVPSEPVTVTVPGQDVTPPTKPVLTVGMVGDTVAQFSLNATDNSGSPYFEIYRDGVLVQGNYFGGSFFDTNLNPGTSYVYTVIAKDQSGNASVVSDPLQVTTAQYGGGTPTDPGGVEVTNMEAKYNSHSVVYTSWTVSDEGSVDFYDVYRDGVMVASNVYTPYHVDYTVQPDTQYSYTVVVHDFEGNVSAHSDPLVVTTLPDPDGVDVLAPMSPSYLYGYYEDGGLNLFWDSSVDNFAVTGYKLYRDGALLTTVAAPEFFDTNVILNEEYDYTVVAVDASGNHSGMSEVFTLKAEEW